jgi:hypothetical protein
MTYDDDQTDWLAELVELMTEGDWMTRVLVADMLARSET